MEQYRMKEQDYIHLENLIKTSISIETLYKKLFDLEISEKKYTNEYYKILDYLKISLDVENKLYNQIISTLSNMEFSKFISFLLNEKVAYNFKDNMSSIIYMDYNNANIRRIINILIHIILKNKERVQDKNIIDFINKFSISNFDASRYASFNNLKILIPFEKDILKAYILFLKKYIDLGEIDNNIKEKIIKNMYYVCYENKSIEKCFLNGRFNFSKIKFCRIANSFNVKDFAMPIITNLKDSYCFKICLNQIVSLLNNNDSDKVLGLTFFEAALCFMSEAEIKYIQDVFIDIISKLKKSGYIVNSDVEMLINNCFKNVKQDKEIIKCHKVK